MEDLSTLSLADLKRRLATLEEELEELEEEKGFVLRQTGFHLPGRKVKEYEAQTVTLTESIKELREELNRR